MQTLKTVQENIHIQKKNIMTTKAKDRFRVVDPAWEYIKKDFLENLSHEKDISIQEVFGLLSIKKEEDFEFLRKVINENSKVSEGIAVIAEKANNVEEFTYWVILSTLIRDHMEQEMRSKGQDIARAMMSFVQNIDKLIEREERRRKGGSNEEID